MSYKPQEPTLQQIRNMSTEKLRAYCVLTSYQDERARDELDERAMEDEDVMYYQDDTPSLENCDGWGTGEGKYHGRM